MHEKILMAFVIVAAAFSGVAETDGRSLTVMSYNIHGGWGKDGSKWNLWNPIDVIRRAKPDVCAMQEVSWGGKAEGFQVDQPTIMGHILAPLWRTAKGRATDRGNGAEGGNCILYQEKSLSTVSIPLPGEKEPRVLVAVEFPDCWVATVHLSTTKSFRLKSVPLILEFAAKQTKPVILTGDWNARPDSAEVGELRKGFKILSDEKVFTCPTVKPDETIDYIAVDLAHAGKVTVEESKVLTDEVEGSDHYPLLMRLRIAK